MTTAPREARRVAIDGGTHASRAAGLDGCGQVPASGTEAISSSRSRVVAASLTSQRASCVLWFRRDGQPIVGKFYIRPTRLRAECIQTFEFVRIDQCGLILAINASGDVIVVDSVGR